MSIADELREVARTRANPELYVVVEADTLFDIANRIDEEHEKAMGEQFESLTIGMEPMTDENMAEDGWVRLPVDGDGKPIHVGDVITHLPDGIKELAPETVKRIVLSKDEQRIVTEECSYSMPKFLRHYHEPTVEDVLREMCLEIDHRCERGGIDYDELFAEYAERIREAVEHA